MRKIKINLDKLKETGKKREKERIDLGQTILSACMYCHRIKVGLNKEGEEEFREVTPELYERLPGFIGLSHGICTPCFEKNYGEELRNRGIEYNPDLNNIHKFE